MLMKDSRMTAAWLADAVARNPITRLETGDIRTCPVRLAFADNVLKAGKNKNDDGTERETFGCTLLFPPGAEQGIGNVLWAMWLEAARAAFPRNFDPQGNPQGLHWPLHDGATKPQYSGFTPGLHFMAASSQYKPAVVDPALNPIVDPARVYSGVWAIAGLNVYSYKNKKTGVSFGLQTLMIVADDEKLAGAGPDPKQVFAGVTIDANFNPASQFGGGVMPPATGIARPPGPPGMPGPGGGFARPPGPPGMPGVGGGAALPPRPMTLAEMMGDE